MDIDEQDREAMRERLSGTRKKLRLAVKALAVSASPIRERLAGAWDALYQISLVGLSPQLGGELELILATSAPLVALDDAECEELAGRIFELYKDVLEASGCD